jgi:molybdopterin-guanine dinucleotide biosynthesis protein MobB
MRAFSIIGDCREKAALVQQLVEHLRGLGRTVSTIKRVSDEVDLDRPGKDTYLQRLAGAHEVVLANSFRSAILEEYAQAQSEPDVEALLSRLKPADIVLLEGFRLCSYPKLEVIGRSEDRRPLCHDDNSVIAVTGPGATRSDNCQHCVPRYFDIDDIFSIATFVLAHSATPGWAGERATA